MAWGLSPHGRGILGRMVYEKAVRGPIPAWAGDTRHPLSEDAPGRAYPRMGGGYAVVGGFALIKLGLSPHGRGIL